VVSDLREQARFVREQGVGTVFTPGDAADFARAVRVLLARRTELAAAARSPEITARHGWEAAERALHGLWRRLVPTPVAPPPVEIAPDPAREPQPRGLLVVGDPPTVRPLLDAWPADAGPATQR
ncbi:glycosyl transferase, partial [Xanthomonas citri pv. citri]|nr:glycosyl transferase [Xanthomonas citri pv. citri]